jgi:hypothetical protein
MRRAPDRLALLDIGRQRKEAPGGGEDRIHQGGIDGVAGQVEEVDIARGVADLAGEHGLVGTHVDDRKS